VALGVVLTLRALGLGDLLTGLPALRALRQAFPYHRHILATSPGVAPLAVHAGVADAVLPVDGLARLPWVRPRPGVAVNLHGRGPQSHDVLAATRPWRLIAFGRWPHGGPAWREDEHEVARWVRLLDESGIPADPTRLEIHPPPVSPSLLASGATLLHPGAASPARRWPAERWAAVARAETGAGHGVVVTGDATETCLAHQVAARAGLPDDAVLAGQTGVLELAAVVAAAGRVVCGDTGVSHLATALGRPSVTLCGPVSPARWGPPPDRPRHIALWAGREGDPHGTDVDPGLLDIGVDDVLAALARLRGEQTLSLPAGAWRRARSCRPPG
jgi:ADP-heptose:LPS heptosyltransferase